MSSSTTIYNSAPFARMGSIAPTKDISSLGTGVPQQWDAFSEQGHPGAATSRMKMFEPFFGVRPNDKGFEVNPYTQMWNWQQENYTLPDAYVGSNMYILNILITSIFLGDQWPVTLCLPWKLKEDSMEIQWQEWHFNDHILDRSPEETLPRTLTSTRTQHSAGMKRYGKACTFEDGFLTTPMGKTQWAMSLKQIYNAIVETACFEVCFTLMKSPPAHDHLAEFRGSGTISSDTKFIRSILEQAELMFLPQKRPEGWVSLISKYVQDFTNRNRHEPNGLIIPQGTRRYHQHLSLQTPYYLTGNKDAATNMFNYATSGMQVLESRDFRIGEHEDNLDPFIQQASFGGFFLMNNKGSRTAPPEEYKTAMRNTVAYDEFRDDHGMVDFIDSIRYAGLWYNFLEDENPQVTDIGNSILSTFSSQWSILEYGSEQNWFLKCITHKTRKDSLIRFLHLATACGYIDKQKEDEILDMWKLIHATPVQVVNFDPKNSKDMSKLVQDNIEGYGDDAESADADYKKPSKTKEYYTNKIKSGLKDKLIKLLKSEKFEIYDTVITGDTLFKLGVFSEVAENKTSPLEIRVFNRNNPDSVENPFYMNKAFKFFRVNKDGVFERGVSDEDEISTLITNCIMPLEIERVYLSKFLELKEDGSTINSTGELQISLPSHISFKDASLVWLNFILSFYLSLNDSYAFDDLDYAEMVNNAMEKTIIKLGESTFGKDQIIGSLNTNFKLDTLKYFPGSGGLNKFLVKIIVRLKKGEDLVHNDFGKFQGKSSAIGEISHEEFKQLEHISALIEDAGEKTEEYSEKRTNWIKDVWTHLPVNTHDMRNTQEELLLAYDFFSSTVVKDHMDILAKAIKESPSFWKVVRSIMERNISIRDTYNFSTVQLLKMSFKHSIIESFLKHSKEALFLNYKNSVKNMKTIDGIVKIIDKTFEDGDGFVFDESSGSFIISTKLEKNLAALSSQTMLIKFINKKLEEVNDLYQSSHENDKSRAPVKKLSNKSIDGDVTPLETIIINILKLWSPYDARFIRHCLLHDLPVGFGTRNDRSHMTYLVGSGILMDLNGAAGNTFFGHADFKVGKDAGKKMTYGSFHMYSAAVVTKPTLVQQIPCVTSKAYLYGNDLRFWDPTKAEHIEAFTSGELDVASIASQIMPADWDTDLPFLDRTGKFGSRANVSAELEAKVDFPFAQLYNEKWNLEGDNTTNLLVSIKQPPRCNTLCFRDHQFIYNHATRMYDTWIKNKGPWGERVMPGCGKVRSGYAMHLEIPNYSESKTFTLNI